MRLNFIAKKKISNLKRRLINKGTVIEHFPGVVGFTVVLMTLKLLKRYTVGNGDFITSVDLD